MKKKGLVAIGLAGVLAVGMCMPVFAAEGDKEITQETVEKNGGTEVSYEVTETYSVTIH